MFFLKKLLYNFRSDDSLKEVTLVLNLLNAQFPKIEDDESQM